MPSHDFDCALGKCCSAPEAGKRDDRLVLANELLEVLDPLQGHVVLGVAKLDVGARVRAVFRDRKSRARPAAARSFPPACGGASRSQNFTCRDTSTTMTPSTAQPCAGL